MVITNERAELLANYLKADPARAKELLEMNVEDALAKLNSEGYDFEEDELLAFDELMANVKEDENGELDQKTLDAVSGGFITVGTAALVVSIVSWGAPYAVKAGKWIGNKLASKIYR